ncbi:MAG: type II toxin-antitoxin system Phd/YefM family antitoxin [Acidobacteriota bacterium]
MKTEPVLKPNSDWQIQTAKARFSELFRRARTEGPQRITRQGKEAVIMLPAEEYEKLVRPPEKEQSLHDFLRQSPLMGLKLDLRRNKSRSRDIKF